MFVYYSDRYKEHQTGAHPENAKRMDAIVNALRQECADKSIQWKDPRMASWDELELVHDRSHIQAIEALARKGGGMADPDTVVSAASFEIARLSAGAALAAVDAVCKGETNHAFVVSRPPGHHALRDRAMGFCLFNNIAIAARYAQKTHDLKHVLILDWDVHHGNGTQAIFYEDNTVYYISTHQYPHYPGTGLPYETGKGKGEGFTRNLPFPALTEAETVVAAVREAMDEIVPEFKPDLILVSSGFDSHRDDPLGNWMLVEKHFAALTEIVCRHAEKTCKGRVISCLEGGYNLESLAASCVAHCKELIKK